MFNSNSRVWVLNSSLFGRRLLIVLGLAGSLAGVGSLSRQLLGGGCWLWLEFVVRRSELSLFFSRLLS